MFGLGTSFKSGRYSVFDYTPRYYDERKERLKKLKEKYKDSTKNHDEDDITITFTKKNLKDAWKKSKKTSGDPKATRRLAIIIATLVGVIAYIFELHTLL